MNHDAIYIACTQTDVDREPRYMWVPAGEGSQPSRKFDAMASMMRQLCRSLDLWRQFESGQVSITHLVVLRWDAKRSRWWWRQPTSSEDIYGAAVCGMLFESEAHAQAHRRYLEDKGRDELRWPRVRVLPVNDWPESSSMHIEVDEEHAVVAECEHDWLCVARHRHVIAGHYWPESEHTAWRCSKCDAEKEYNYDYPAPGHGG